MVCLHTDMETAGSTALYFRNLSAQSERITARPRVDLDRIRSGDRLLGHLWYTRPSRRARFSPSHWLADGVRYNSRWVLNSFDTLLRHTDYS